MNSKYPSKTEHWGHQTAILDRVMVHEGYGIFTGFGTGKSKVAIDTIRATNAKVSMIITLKGILDDGHWQREFEKHYDGDVEVITLDSLSAREKADDLKTYLSWNKQTNPRIPLVLIINYESVWRGELGKLIASIRWDLIALDEAQKAKAAGSSISKFLARFNRKDRAAKRLALTGTPLYDKPLDIYGIYRFLDPTIFGTRYDAFANRYAIFGGYQNREIKKYIRQAEFREKMDSICYYVESDDVLELPDIVHETYTAPLEAPARKLYDEFKKELVAELDGRSLTADNVLVKVTRLMQICGGTVTMDDGTEVEVSRAKRGLFKDIVQDLKEEPVVVFCNYRKEIEAVIEECRDLKIGCSELSGTSRETDEWKRGETRVLVTQIQAGGAGIDLTRSRYVIYYSKPQSLGLYQQSMGRIRRPESDKNKPVCYIHLHLSKTIDGLIYKALEEKTDVIRYITDHIRKR